jgi:hypothetical protein
VTILKSHEAQSFINAQYYDSPAVVVVQAIRQGRQVAKFGDLACDLGNLLFGSSITHQYLLRTAKTILSVFGALLSKLSDQKLASSLWWW